MRDPHPTALEDPSRWALVLTRDVATRVSRKQSFNLQQFGLRVDVRKNFPGIWSGMGRERGMKLSAWEGLKRAQMSPRAWADEEEGAAHDDQCGASPPPLPGVWLQLRPSRGLYLAFAGKSEGAPCPCTEEVVCGLPELPGGQALQEGQWVGIRGDITGSDELPWCCMDCVEQCLCLG